MNEALMTFIYFGIGWLVTVLAILFGLNFLTKGFIFKFIRVKGSRGKLQLIRLKTATDTYWTTGRFDKLLAYYIKTRDKEELSLTNVDKDCFQNIMGIMMMDYDSINHVIAIDDYSATKDIETTKRGYVAHKMANDPVKTNQYIIRASRLPREDISIFLIIAMVLSFIAIVVGAAAAFYAYQDQMLLKQVIDILSKQPVVIP